MSRTLPNGWRAFGFFLVGLFAAAAITAENRSREQGGHKVCFERQCFNVTLAINDEVRARGLQAVSFLPPEKGMLFVFPESGIHGFWMKDTLIPLDMIWLDKEKTVVHVQANAQPCPTEPCPSYTPPVNATYVLEINGGLAARHGIKPGQKAAFQINP